MSTIRQAKLSNCLITGLCSISWATSSAEPNDRANSASISGNGRYVAYNSHASNLVPGDTNTAQDVFVYDRVTDTTTRVSVASSGTQANDLSTNESISADGRYVAFLSFASNLVVGDTNGLPDVFVHDREIRTTRRVSVNSAGVQSNGYNYELSISADGRYVAFLSAADNLVPDDTNGVLDVFVHDLEAKTTTVVSISSAGEQSNDTANTDRPSFSADGRHVAFVSSASNLVAGDTGRQVDAFVHDRESGVTTRVSVDSAGNQANGRTVNVSMSADGRFVAFQSNATNLVRNDTNGGDDVFIHDRSTGITQRVTVNSAGAQATDISFYTALNADGRYVVFSSRATNLVPGDTNGVPDTFVHDRHTGTTTRVSVSSDGVQANADAAGALPSMSADGRYVTFLANATNLVPGDTNRRTDAFLRDLVAMETVRIAEGSGGGTIPPIYVGLTSVPDLNGNSSPELAAVRTLADNQADVLIRDSATSQALGSISFRETGLMLADLTVVRDVSGEGYPELVALFPAPDSPAVVQVKDAASGREVGRLLFFGEDWDAKAVTGIDRGRGGPEIAVLGFHEEAVRGGIEIRPAEDDGTVDRTQFPVDGREYRDITVLDDITGDGQPELATLFTRRPDGAGKVVIKDGTTKNWVDTYSFPGPDLGTATAIGVAGLGDVSGDGAPDLAVLFRKANGQGVVQLRDGGTGRWLHQMQFFGKDWSVLAVTSLDSNGDGVPDLAVLGVRDDGTAAAVQVRDASNGQALNWIGFPDSAAK